MNIFTTGHQTMEDHALEEALEVSLTRPAEQRFFRWMSLSVAAVAQG
jgi:hypothetical protein